MEVLSILGKVGVGVRGLRQVMSWSKASVYRDHILAKILKWLKQNPKARYAQCAHDALQFLLSFHTCIITSAPHIYISGLPFVPQESEIGRNSRSLFEGVIKVQKGQMDQWPGRPERWIGHTAPVFSIAYSPDGHHVVSGSYDNTIRIWDADTGRPVGEPWEGHTDGVMSVAYSPDGHHVVSGSSDNTIRIWDADTGRPVGQPWEGHTSTVCSVAYSPDGHHVVSGSSDNTIRIWDADTGRPVGGPLEGNAGEVFNAAYSPDGQHIVSGSEDNTTQVWDVDNLISTQDHHPLGHQPDVVSPATEQQLNTLLIHGLPISLITDSSGWIHHPDGGLLFWVPEDCRNGLASPAILTIPTTGHHRVVRLDFTNFQYGTSWRKVKTN